MRYFVLVGRPPPHIFSQVRKECILVMIMKWLATYHIYEIPLFDVDVNGLIIIAFISFCMLCALICSLVYVALFELAPSD